MIAAVWPIFLLILGVNVQAQDRRKLMEVNADCSGIIDLLPKDTIFGPTTPPVGPGNLLEIQGDEQSLYAFEKEHNSVWYRFRAPYDATLSLEIIPVSEKDDYDFILYKYSGKYFCDEFNSDPPTPVRSCISRNDVTTKSITGLKDDAVDEYIHSGPGPSFSKSVEVKKGEIYVLVLDNVYPGGQGHTLRLHYRKPQPVVELVDTVPVANVAEKSSLSVTIVDKQNGVLMNAQSILINKRKSSVNPVFSDDSASSFTVDIDLASTYNLKVIAPDYFDYSRDIKTIAIPENMNIRVEMNKIEVGKNVVFEDILFYGDAARFLPESVPVLEGLSGTMQRNPNLVIEIQGHVNCPISWSSCKTKKMKTFNMNLSKYRAKAVYDYLMESGTAAERMTYIGYGADRMIYPDARSEDKMKRNRRVEIVVKSK